jgi:spermidine synthase
MSYIYTMEARVVDSRVEDGKKIELWQRGEAWEVRVDGRTAFASDARRSEQSLAELALGLWRGRDDISVLLGGLGMGYALRAVLATYGVCRVDVVEVSPAVIEWEEKYFCDLNGGSARDPRVRVHQAELGEFLARRRTPESGLPPDGWFACILDLDEWPTQVTRPGNEKFYAAEGVERLEAALRPGGVLGVWTTQKDMDLIKRLSARLQDVSQVAIPVDVAGGSGLDYVYRGRRRPRRMVN